MQHSYYTVNCSTVVDEFKQKSGQKSIMWEISLRICPLSSQMMCKKLYMHIIFPCQARWYARKSTGLGHLILIPGTPAFTFR